MRWLGVVALLLVACGDDTKGQAWLEDSFILVDGYNETNMECRSGLCPHDENTDLVIFDGATYLVYRTAISQVLGPNSSLRILRSDDHGANWQLLAIVPAPSDRDLRDPSFFTIDGKLAIKAITRLPVNSTRDSDVDSISVVTISPDGGHTWGALEPIAPPTWSFWRIKDDSDGVHYSAAYEDGDKSVVLWASVDGVTWQQGALIYGIAEDTPLETELVFDASGVMTALVRVDGNDAELLGYQGRLRTIVCKAPRPYTTFDCSHVIDGQRLDGPVAFDYAGTTYVVARKHLAGVSTKKRTSLFAMGPDLTTIREIGEFPSAGDTAYAGVAPIAGGRFLVTYYSSNLAEDNSWARAIFGPTDIWQATIDLDRL